MAGTTTSAAAAIPREMAPKRTRPHNLALETAAPRRHSLLQFDSSLLDNYDLPSASPSSASPSSPIDSIPNFEPSSDDIIKDLAALEKLRQSVHKNLRLRPINASTLIRTHSPRLPVDIQGRPPSWYDITRDDIASPSSAVSSTASVYFTPSSDTPLSAYFGFSSNQESGFPEVRSSTPEHISPPGHEPRPRPFHHSSLHSLLSRSPRPLLIDTRPINTFLLSHLSHSVNVAIPSLILKRCRKPGAGFQSIDALRQYITTDRGKRVWDDTIYGDLWDGNVLIFDEEMDEKFRNSMQSTAWALLHAIPPLLLNGSADYLEGGLSSARADASLQYLFVSGDSHTPLEQHQSQPKKAGGLFQLDTSTSVRTKQFPQVEQTSDTPSSSSNKTPSRSWTIDIVDSQSPPPQSIIPPRQPARRPSVPSLRKIDTQAVERLPKLSLKTQFSKSATHATGPPMPWHGKDLSPLNIAPPPPSTSHLNLSFPTSLQVPSPATGSSHMLSKNGSSSNGLLPTTPLPSQPSSPRCHTPVPPSPMTARPEDNDPPTTEEPFPVFTISTILPNFLFLGPELTTEEHVKDLQELGVKKILNIAAECDDDQGLHLRQRFESYVKIPMRDTVEEENIRRGVKEVCDILDDARLHSSPTYIHCKAGKSRSVTAVMGYLIHANRWTLSRAYSFVLERRKGISPNIGFVSELMNFEEEELGGKSVGVVNMDLDHQGENGVVGHAGGGVAGGVGVGGSGARRPSNIRESLPPTFNVHSYSFSGADGEGPRPEVGDSGQEMEIRDAFGRYRHARRAPVDETTLQPMRRVSKAGLESGGYSEMDIGHWS